MGGVFSYWSFVRRNHQSPVDLPHKGPGTRVLMFNEFCQPNQKFNKQSNCRWIERQRRSFYVTLMLNGIIWSKIIQYDRQQNIFQRWITHLWFRLHDPWKAYGRSMPFQIYFKCQICFFTSNEVFEDFRYLWFGSSMSSGINDQHEYELDVLCFIVSVQ